MSKMITLPIERLRALFDMATGSLDFDSGHLDTEDVEHLRAVAGDLGVDPFLATPRAFRSQHPHPFEGFENDIDAGPDWGGCVASDRRCRAQPDDPIHESGRAQP